MLSGVLIQASLVIFTESKSYLTNMVVVPCYYTLLMSFSRKALVMLENNDSKHTSIVCKNYLEK